MTVPAPPIRSNAGVSDCRQAGISPAARLLLLLVAAAAAALLAAAAASASSTAGHLEVPQRAELARAGSAIADSSLAAFPSPRVLRPGTYWGGPYTSSTGETVTVYASNTYPQDPATAQRWADFLASLVHGPELSSLIAYLAPENEVSAICGPQALACYSGVQNLLVAPGDDPSGDTSAEAVVTHEYGHHVAAYRSNAPWDAIDFGTKRWASYENVCAGARTGAVYPGAESLPRYRLNPGEAFAETYRVLNERTAGLAEAPWDIVSQQFYPDDAALEALREDVVSPWQTSTAVSRTASLTKTTRTRTYSIATPLDGAVTATLRVPASARFTLSLVAANGATLAQGSGSRTVSLSTLVCGRRSLQ